MRSGTIIVTNAMIARSALSDLKCSNAASRRRVRRREDMNDFLAMRNQRLERFFRKRRLADQYDSQRGQPRPITRLPNQTSGCTFRFLVARSPYPQEKLYRSGKTGGTRTMPDYSKYEALKVEKADRVATVTLNRPDSLNAVNAVMHHELMTIWLDLAEDQEVNAIILTGAGRAFCAGGDVKNMASR